VIRRAEALAEAVSGGVLVAIAGTHGKTTTTVLTTEALAAAGRDPTGVVGGRVGSWGGNLRSGGLAVYVVEADEYDRSFLALRPTVAVVTNVEADHLDIYADLTDIRTPSPNSCARRGGSCCVPMTWGRIRCPYRAQPRSCATAHPRPMLDSSLAPVRLTPQGPCSTSSTMPKCWDS